jgi:aminoglycoside phosphotransferase (APT) family kinase protein
MSEAEAEALIDERLVSEALSASLNARPSRIEHLQTNPPRCVYSALLDGAPVVLKAEVENGERDYALALEAWALEQAGALGLPVPAVLHIDCSTVRFPFRFLVMQRCEGVRLSEAGLPIDAYREALSAAGGALARLHRISVEGYGRLDDDLFIATGAVRGRSDTWAGVTSEAAGRAVAYLEERDVLYARQAQHVRDRLAAYTLPAAIEPRLLHGDFGVRHLHVDHVAGTLTGIIDFGDREAGDPAWDVAGFWLWNEPANAATSHGFSPTRALLEGYEAESGGAVEMELVRAYGLARILAIIQRRHAAGMKQRVERGLEMLDWVLR